MAWVVFRQPTNAPFNALYAPFRYLAPCATGPGAATYIAPNEYGEVITFERVPQYNQPSNHVVDDVYQIPAAQGQQGQGGIYETSFATTSNGNINSGTGGGDGGGGGAVVPEMYSAPGGNGNGSDIYADSSSNNNNNNNGNGNGGNGGDIYSSSASAMYSSSTASDVSTVSTVGTRALRVTAQGYLQVGGSDGYMPGDENHTAPTSNQNQTTNAAANGPAASAGGITLGSSGVVQPQASGGGVVLNNPAVCVKPRHHRPMCTRDGWPPLLPQSPLHVLGPVFVCAPAVRCAGRRFVRMLRGSFH